jgi:hypothetical protein
VTKRKEKAHNPHTSRAPAKANESRKPKPKPVDIGGGVKLHPKLSETAAKEELAVIDNGDVARGRMFAAITTTPGTRHGALQHTYGSRVLNGDNPATVTDAVAVLTNICDGIEGGNNNILLRMLASQAISLDTIATDLLLKAARHTDLEPVERLTRLALKAQANSRATIEALGKMMRGGEQVVRHVHVSEGGQAVIAGTFNHGGALPEGEGQNEKPGGQSDAADKA